MSQPLGPTQFRGKTWIFVATAMISGSLGIFGLVMGPLFLSGAVKKADGRPSADGGIPLIIIGAGLSCAAALAAFNVIARRQPLVRLYREGLAVNLIGASSLDGLPYIPGLGRAIAFIRLAWLIISLQGFKQVLVYAPWESFRAARVSGMTMQRNLTIIASFARAAAEGEQPEPVGESLTFAEVEFAARLDIVAHSITMYSSDAQARQRLPSWCD